jgi:lysophospholipase L1-like esterase
MGVKNILCFGDSNTWGFVPGAYNPKTSYMERYPLSNRWPGVMSRILGDEFHTIEEGHGIVGLITASKIKKICKI